MFYFALARELKMTVKQLLANLDSRELAEWQAYFQIVGKPKDERPKPQDLSEMLKAQLAIKKG